MTVLEAASGRLVFKSNDRNDKWNGIKLGSGDMARAHERFTWVARVKDETGNLERFTGAITIHATR